LFQGVRVFGGEQFSLSEHDRSPLPRMTNMRPQPEGRDVGFQWGYGHCDTLAANWDDPNDPNRTFGLSRCETICQVQELLEIFDLFV
jgi:hypothetical protein